MKIFLFVLLGLLLLADTIWVGQGSSIDKLLGQMKEAEEKRDGRIENKMDQATKNLNSSVKQMHEKLKAFIASDAEVSNNMKAQFDSIWKQVLKLETSVTNAFNLPKMRMAKPTDTKAHKIHQPPDHDGEPEEGDEEDVETSEEDVEEPEESEKSEKRGRRSRMGEPEEEISWDEDEPAPQPEGEEPAVINVNTAKGRRGSRGRPRGGSRSRGGARRSQGKTWIEEGDKEGDDEEGGNRGAKKRSEYWEGFLKQNEKITNI